MSVRSGVARFKLVISATRQGIQLHPSLEALPGERRQAAKKALEGDSAATLLIADRAGLGRMKRLLEQVETRAKESRAPMDLAKQLALGFLGAAAVLLGLLIWAWFH